jgi:hypothetical protein
MKLISMTDYVLEQEKYLDITNRQKLEHIINYANFLKQPLELWMFVPCDLEGNVLIEPIEQNPIYWSKEYQQAKERVLFEGFDLRDYNLLMIQKLKTIEDLIPHNLTLTETAKSLFKK